MHIHASLILLAATSTQAQIEGTATWLWNVTTDDADAIVEPGESAVISLFIDMDPDVNYPDGPVLGFAAAAFDLFGDAGAANGHVTDWQVYPPLMYVFGDLTTTDGVNLFGTHAAQLFEVFTPADPINVFTFTWQPDTYAIYQVGYSSITWNPFDATPVLGLTAVWISEIPFFAEWPTEEAQINFSVVPPPASITLLAATILGRRRRSR